jgi:hypothetical protein
MFTITLITILQYILVNKLILKYGNSLSIASSNFYQSLESIILENIAASLISNHNDNEIYLELDRYFR